LGKDDAVALATAGFALADFVEDVEGGDALINQALMLNPNLALAWLFSGWAKVDLGQPEKAIEQFNRAMRLSPNDPQRFSTYCGLGMAHFIADRYREALKFAELAWREQPENLYPRCIAAASAALAGQMETAQKAMLVLRQLSPNLRLSNLQNLQPFYRPEAYAKWENGMRLAGLPE
jgi:tetratricopeptide (TPR) repeat protein